VCPDGAGLFTVREKKEHVLAQRRARLQSPQDFQDRDDTGPIVCRARGARCRVIVRHQQDGALRIAPRETGEDVLHCSGNDRARVYQAYAKRLLHLWLQAEGANLLQEVIANVGVSL
jgi:hypothetical protein